MNKEEEEEKMTLSQHVSSGKIMREKTHGTFEIKGKKKQILFSTEKKEWNK